MPRHDLAHKWHRHIIKEARQLIMGYASRNVDTIIHSKDSVIVISNSQEESAQSDTQTEIPV